LRDGRIVKGVSRFSPRLGIDGKPGQRHEHYVQVKVTWTRRVVEFMTPQSNIDTSVIETPVML